MGVIATRRYDYRGVPGELILELKAALHIDTFIETGTYKGETSIWASDHFIEVKTMEASLEIYSKLKLQKFPNILPLYGDSRVLLKECIDKGSIFYLDAHNSAGQTFNSYPLLDEIDIINSSGYIHAIIIDDARFCLSLYNGENYCNIVELVMKLAIKDRYVVVFDDMVIAVPMEVKSVVDDYTLRKSKIYMKQFELEMKFKLLWRLFKILRLKLKKL
jgi:hypothetical protein